MHGRLFTLFEIPFPSYFVLLITGFIVATGVGALWAKRIGHDPDVIVDLGIAMLIAGTVGSRLLHVIADGYFWDYVHLCTDPSKVAWKITKGECLRPEYEGTWDAVRQVCVPIAHRDIWHQVDRCLEWAKFWAGGLTYYGGFLGASLAAVWVLRRDRFPFWRAADMAGIVVPLGISLGRMGCLLGGCCFGVPVAGPLGLRFPAHSPASEAQFKAGQLSSPFETSLPVHPTQLYESAAALGIAALLGLVLHGRKRYDGQVFLAFVVLYATARFALEFVRDDDRGGLVGLSTSQLIGIALVVAAASVHRVRMAHVRARS